MLRSDLSPGARVALIALAARLPIALGGFGLANYHATRHAAYTASFLATWPIIARAVPPHPPRPPPPGPLVPPPDPPHGGGPGRAS